MGYCEEALNRCVYDGLADVGSREGTGIGRKIGMGTAAIDSMHERLVMEATSRCMSCFFRIQRHTSKAA